MSSILTIAAQGLMVQATRLAVAADNIVNAWDTTPATADGAILGALYQPRTVVGVSDGNGGVTARVVPVTPASALIADGTSPTGYSAMPAVDLASEMLTLTMATTSYRAAAKLLAVDGDLSASLLNAVA